MKNILFGLNQNSDRKIEESIKEKYLDLVGESFNYDCEYYLAGIWKALTEKEYNVLLLKEDLEGNSVGLDYLDDITDKFPNLNLIYIINNEHERDNYVKQLFNMGIYNVLYKEDLKISNIVELIHRQRSKMDAKIYLDIDEVESVEGESNLETINDRELDIILYNLKTATLETISPMYDEIAKSYTDKQLLFLVTILPRDIQDLLLKSGNEKYDKIHKRWLLIGSDISESEDSSSKEIVKTKIKTRTVTKIEKEYIHSIPSDYNKIVAFVGCRQAGTTTVIDLVSKQFIKNGKKVAVLDLTSNKTFYYMKCWGDTEISNKEKRGLEYLNKGEDYPIILGEKYKLYTQVENQFDNMVGIQLDFFQIIEQIRYDNDIILIDMDFDTPVEFLKYGVTSIYLVNDMNVINMITVKDYIRKLINKGVNSKKITLIVNKFIKSKARVEDILSCINEPIPYLEKESEINYIDINKDILKIDFEIQSYTNLISSYLYIDDEVVLSKQMEEQALEICKHIYPLSVDNKKGLGDKFKNLLPFKK